MGWGNNASLWGLEVSGDIGPLSVYTDRFGKKVAYPKSPPKEPPSEKQIQQRARFRSAQVEYTGLTDPEKLAYEQLVQAASLCMTGQNLFIHVALRNTFGTLNTLQTQWGISVTPPTYQPFPAP
jgi:hypothetical protein